MADFNTEDMVLIVNRHGVASWVEPWRAREMVALDGARLADATDIDLCKNDTIGINVDEARAAMGIGVRHDGRGRKARARGEGEDAGQ